MTILDHNLLSVLYKLPNLVNSNPNVFAMRFVCGILKGRKRGLVVVVEDTGRNFGSGNFYNQMAKPNQFLNS